MISAMERAFELARSGRCRSVRDVKQALKKEGFGNVEIMELGVGSVPRDLRRACLAAPKPSLT
ncbi:hypothetical protein [Brevundimonas sp.]